MNDGPNQLLDEDWTKPQQCRTGVAVRSQNILPVVWSGVWITRSQPCSSIPLELPQNGRVIFFPESTEEFETDDKEYNADTGHREDPFAANVPLTGNEAWRE